MSLMYRARQKGSGETLITKTITAGTSPSTYNASSDSADGYSSVTVNPTPSHSKTVTPTNSQQTVYPDEGKLLSSVIVEAGASPNLQRKSLTITPSANWSGSTTNTASIEPDSGYDGLLSVGVAVPMCRDYMLFNTIGIESPSTLYNGDTAQSNSEDVLKIKPTKTGMVYEGSYLYLKASSNMGNATAEDVTTGKTFTSGNGVKIIGTKNPPSGTKYLSYTENGTFTADITDYSQVSITLNVSGNVKVKTGTFYGGKNGRVNVNIGFKPKFLAILTSNTSSSAMIIYNEELSTTQFHYAGASTYASMKNLGTSSNYFLYSINDDGFTMNKYSTASDSYYFAIG